MSKHNIAWGLTLLLAGGCAVLGPHDPQRALHDYRNAWRELDWGVRSDWFDAVSDGAPGAIGDGIADDTAALQAALDRIAAADSSCRTVYLPTGTYRLTRRLDIPPMRGGALIGQGSSTILLWAGETNGTVCHITGANRFRFTGLTWDGQGIAATAVQHDLAETPEGSARHQYEVFRGFRDAALQAAGGGPYGALVCDDCVFDRNGEGIATAGEAACRLYVNRCIFLRNGSALACRAGNLFLRNSHFEKSAIQDVLVPAGAHSIRRCTSTGSSRFIASAQEGALPNPLTVQDCLVRSWTNPLGAIVTHNRGPLLVVDCVFENAPTSAAPIWLNNPVPFEQRVLHAGCTSTDSRRLVNLGLHGRAMELDPGPTGGLMPARANDRWTHRPMPPTRIFDAKAQFGAAGDGLRDDTAALTAAVQAARAHGQGALAYFPAGRYRISEPIEIGDGDYAVGGCGAATRLEWAGPDEGVMLDVRDASRLRLENLTLDVPGRQSNVRGIRHTSRGGRSRVEYDAIRASNPDRPDMRGLELLNLPPGANVRVLEFHGSLHVLGSARARVVAERLSCAGTGLLHAAGTTTEQDGFLGVLSATAFDGPQALLIEDGLEAVVCDLWRTQPSGPVNITNSTNPADADRVTIQGVSGPLSTLLPPADPPPHFANTLNAIRKLGAQDLE